MRCRRSPVSFAAVDLPLMPESRFYDLAPGIACPGTVKWIVSLAITR
jgi:hypothetical protein